MKKPIIERDNTGKFIGKREFINREDYEYTLNSTFFNATILIAVVSAYIVVAYAVVQQFKK